MPRIRERKLKDLVYLAETRDHQIVKIGMSIDFLKRGRELEMHLRRVFQTSERIRFIGFAIGGKRKERAILRKVSAAHKPLRGWEWFRWSKEVLETASPYFPLSLEAGLLASYRFDQKFPPMSAVFRSLLERAEGGPQERGSGE